MNKLRYQRRVSRSAIWALRLGVFSALLLFLDFLAHRFWEIETPDAVIIATLSAMLATIALLCAVQGFRNLWQNGDKGGTRSFWGGFLSLVVIALLGVVAGFWYISPPIYDVTTDYETPLRFPSTMPERTFRMNAITSRAETDMIMQLSAYPEVSRRRYDASPDRVGQGVDAVLEGFGWERISPAHGILSQQPVLNFAAVAHSPILGLKSDVVIRLQDEGETTLVDMRAVSRYGKRDMGLNAAFITQFMTALEGEVNKAPADAE